MITKTTWRKTPDIYPLHDIRVVDGDTLEARICLPFDQSVTKRIRLKGWWADELEGPWSSQGWAARIQLATWLAGKVVWLHSPSCRLDKYGRVIGHILVDEQIVSPKEVLGVYQLSERVHNEHRAQATQARKAAPASPGRQSGMTTADTQSGSLLGHPGANLNPGATGDQGIWPCPCGPEGTHQGLETCPLPTPNALNPAPKGGLS